MALLKQGQCWKLLRPNQPFAGGIQSAEQFLEEVGVGERSHQCLSSHLLTSKLAPRTSLVLSKACYNQFWSELSLGGVACQPKMSNLAAPVTPNEWLWLLIG